MSQHWHGHWTEGTFTAKRLRNWQVPKWYPSWPDRHCGATKFIANNSGHIVNSTNKAKHSPWGTHKGTWDLPKRITRSMAEELSATPQYKKEIWELHKKKHENLCKKEEQAKKSRRKDIDSLTDTVKKNQADEIWKIKQAQDSDPERNSDSKQDSDAECNPDSKQDPDPGQDSDSCVKQNEED